MNEATAPMIPDNVEQFPIPPKLRVVKALDEAEQNVVDVSARVAEAIEKNRTPRKRKAADPSAAPAARKPRTKKTDPILQASRANDTQAADATGVSTLAEPDPAADASASAVGPELLLDKVIETGSSSPPSWRRRVGRAVDRSFDWLTIVIVSGALLAAGAVAASVFG